MAQKKDKPFFKTFLVPVGTMVASSTTLVVLLVASRLGQVYDIAGFAVGMAASALLVAAVSGGTTLAFVNGDSYTRDAIYYLRLRLVFPLTMAIGFGVSVAYGLASDVSFWAVLAGALSVTFNNLSELEGSILKGKLRTGSVLLSTFLSRLLAVVLVFISTYSVAMLGAALANFTLLKLFVYFNGSSRSGTNVRIIDGIRLGYSRLYVSVAVLDAIANRAPYLVAGAGVVASVEALATIFSAQQGVTAVLISAVFTTMTVRGRTRASGRWMRSVDLITITATVFLAVLGVVLREQIAGILGYNDPAVVVWVALVTLAVIPFVHNRMSQFRDHSSGDNVLIITRLGTAAVAVLVVLIAAWMTNSGTLLAGAWLIAETVGAIFGLAVSAIRRVTRNS